jgi:hypothetical protein
MSNKDLFKLFLLAKGAVSKQKCGA